MKKGRKRIMRTLLTKHILFPAVQSLLKNHCWDYYKELDQIQWYSQEEIEQLQWRKLKALLEHAYENVPMYLQAFQDAQITPADINTLNDLKLLPIQTKTKLRENYPHNTIAQNALEKDKIPNSTSGSTGSPFEFMVSRQLMGMRWGRYLRGNTWTGMDIGEKYLRIWGHHDKPFVERVAIGFTLNMKELSAFDINKDSVQKYAEFISKSQPKCIEAYTSAVVKLARLMKEANITGISVPAVIVSAETLYEGDRELIEEMLHCRVFNRYGAREFGAIAHECSKHKGLHINAESFFVEIVHDGNSNEQNGMGKIVITNLDNFTMPFIRYEIGDIGVFSDELLCKCGRGLPLIGSIEGRTTDFLKTPSGDIIPFLYWNYFFEQYGKYIQQFQVVQEEIDFIIIKVVPTPKYDLEIRSGIINGLQEQLGAEIKLQVDEVGEIPLSPTGKQICVQSKVDMNNDNF